jgi:hippurate hydrolase
MLIGQPSEETIDGAKAMLADHLGLEGHKIPVAYFRLGAMYPDRFAAAKAAGKELPGPHTSKFEPDPEPTLETGVRSMTAVAISLLQ